MMSDLIAVVLSRTIIFYFCLSHIILQYKEAVMRIILVVFLLTISVFAKSQTRALTDNGREVELYDNGTWKYVNDSSATKATGAIVTNNKLFSKSANSTFLVKSNHLNVGVYIDPAKWAFDINKVNEPNPEYKFTLKTGDAYALMLTEKNDDPARAMAPDCTP